MEKIKSVSEAYVQDGKCWTVADKDMLYFNPLHHCKEIKPEMVMLHPEHKLCYVGYNHKGQKVFQYLADSVNVEFDSEAKND